MNTTTWNPHRYIEYFGSKEKLQSATGLYPKAFNKAFNSKVINEAVKSYLDKTANFNQVDRFEKLDDELEKGATKIELMKKYKCSLPTINHEIKKKHDTTTTYTARAKIKRERRKHVDFRNIDYGVIFAIKSFSTFKAVALYLCVSQSCARDKLNKLFGTSDLRGIRYMIEQQENSINGL